MGARPRRTEVALPAWERKVGSSWVPMPTPAVMLSGLEAVRDGRKVWLMT